MWQGGKGGIQASPGSIDIKTQYLRGTALFVPPGWDGTQDLVYGSMCFTPEILLQPDFRIVLYW